MISKKLPIITIVGLLFITTLSSAAAQERSRQKLRRDVSLDIRRVAATVTGVRLAQATVTTVSGTTITVSKDNKTYTVNITGNTIFRRRFWGKSSLSEVSVGDFLNIYGRFTDSAQTIIQAQLIRNVSIEKRFGAFFGNVTALGSSRLTVRTLNRGDLTVSYTSDTKFVNQRGQVIKASDIKVGDKVRVHGMWARNLRTLTEVSRVKDFSIPVTQT